MTYIYYHKRNVLEREDINFVITNLHIKGEEIRFIAESKDIRERASYGVDEGFNLRIAKALQENSADFITKVKDILKKYVG